MKRVFVIIALVLGVTGCGRKLTSVSSNTTTTVKNDSTAISRQITVDSSRYVEAFTLRQLPSVTVHENFTLAQFDSLINALKAMPNNVTKEIVIQDPKLRAQLKIVLDSLGNINLRCTALEQHYFEKSVSDFRYRESLTNELTKVNKENHEQSVQIKEYQKRMGFKNSVIITLIILIVLYMAYKFFF